MKYRRNIFPARRDERGVALVITLVMLSVITFLAITFLVLSQRERGSVNTTTDQAVAKFTADSALERAKVELLAPMLAFTNDQIYDLIESTNFINPAGFNTALGIYQPTNVIYALFPPLAGRVKKQDKRTAYATRSTADFDLWASQVPHPVLAAIPLAPEAAEVTA